MNASTITHASVADGLFLSVNITAKINKMLTTYKIAIHPIDVEKLK